MLSTIGIVAAVLGFIGVVWGIFQKVKAGRVADAPLVKTGDAATRGASVAGPKGAISAQGNVMCQQPLTSPVTGTPCLFYSVKCTATWKEGDSDKSKILLDEKTAAQFAIDDGSGAVWVDAREGGDFEPTQTKTESKGTGLAQVIGRDLTFGQVRISTHNIPGGAKYSVVEQVLPVQSRLYVCGRVADGGGIGAPGWRSLIMSNKSRDELLAAATKSAKVSFLAGVPALVIGIALGVAGHFMGGSDPGVANAAPAQSAAAVSTTQSAAAVAPAETTGSQASPSKPGARPGKPATAPAATAAPTSAPASTAAPAATGKPAAPATAAPATAAPAKPPAAPAPTSAPKK